MQKLKPRGRNVAVKLSEREETTSSGIVIPQLAQDAPQTGVVVAVGEEFDDDSNAIREGDVVLFAQFSGVKATVGGEELILLEDDDVLAFVEDAE